MIERASSYKIDDQRLSPTRVNLDPWDQKLSSEDAKSRMRKRSKSWRKRVTRSHPHPHQLLAARKSTGFVDNAGKEDKSYVQKLARPYSFIN